MCGNGREKKCIAEQSEGIAGHSVAVFGKEVQRHSSVEQSEKWQGHSKEGQRTATQRHRYA